MSDSPPNLELTLIHTSGVIRTITVCSFDTVRSVLVSCGFCPIQALAVANGVSLLLDFSFYSQQVTSGTTIYVFMTRNGDNDTKKQFRSQSVNSERLRLADLSFLPFENGRAHRRLILSLKKTADDAPDGDSGEESTNVDQQSRISEDPLPTLWQTSPRTKRGRAALR
jgi:hypothetical protein